MDEEIALALIERTLRRVNALQGPLTAREIQLVRLAARQTLQGVLIRSSSKYRSGTETIKPEDDGTNEPAPLR